VTQRGAWTSKSTGVRRVAAAAPGSPRVNARVPSMNTSTAPANRPTIGTGYPASAGAISIQARNQATPSHPTTAVPRISLESTSCHAPSSKLGADHEASSPA
jgi:hypothetical protein